MKSKGVGVPFAGDDCGQCRAVKIKRMGSATGGTTHPPRRGRRTFSHQKGEPIPGNWAINNSPKKKRR